jgi:hypothetical protein
MQASGIFCPQFFADRRFLYLGKVKFGLPLISGQKFNQAYNPAKMVG